MVYTAAANTTTININSSLSGLGFVQAILPYFLTAFTDGLPLRAQVCPYCKISGGVSNLSFGFRGVNVIREVRLLWLHEEWSGCVIPIFFGGFCLQLVSSNFLFLKAALNQISLVSCSHHTYQHCNGDASLLIFFL